MTDWFERDRLYGAGLPANVNMDRLARRVQEARLPRVASLSQARAQGFEPVPEEPGLYRKAHAIWAIRTAEDGEGYVVVRLRDEPAPGIEPRTARRADMSVTVTLDTPEPAPESRPEDTLVLAPLPPLELPITDDLRPDEACARAPEPRNVADFVLVAQQQNPPMGPGEYRPEGGGPVQNYHNVPTQLKHETDPGTWVQTNQPFSPFLYKGELVVPEGRDFTLDGQHPATPKADAIGDPGISNPVYPNPAEGDNPGDYVRIRLKDDTTGVVISVLPFEFRRFFDARGDFPRAPVPHRSKPRRPAPMVGPDAQVPDIGTRPTTMTSPWSESGVQQGPREESTQID